MEELLNELKRLDVELKLEGDSLRVVAPAGTVNESLRNALRQHRDALMHMLRGTERTALSHDASDRFEPFALTELQHAYWLGRDSRVELGGVATHLYVELDCEMLDLPCAEEALVSLIERHDMLRAVVDPQGRQRVLADVPRYRIAVDDCTAHSAGAAEAAVLARRDALSHEVRDPARWPLFDVQATCMPHGRTRLHVSLDLLLFDATSIHVFFAQWHALYRGERLERLPVTFRDYLSAEAMRREGAEGRAAREHWEPRINALPPAPELPWRAVPPGPPRFSRREMRLPAAGWNALRHQARAHEVTPSALLLAVFCEVLARWSATPHFTVVLTGGHREPWHPDVPQLIGNFTSVLLHEVDRRDARLGFAGFVSAVQRRLLLDLQHAIHSGVAVRREWARLRGRALDAVMPVVFSSGLAGEGGKEIGDLEQFGRKVHSISQTSQVALDHHVTEQRGELVLNWDAVDAAFAPRVLDAMFEAYRDALERLAADPSAWETPDLVRLPAAMQGRRDDAARTALALPLRPLHEPIVEQARQDGGAVAVVAAGRTLTRAELVAEATAVAEHLQGAVRLGESVAVLMRKGWEQVVAAVGAQMAGAAYVPIDADLPTKRQLELLRQCGARHVLAQPGGPLAGMQEGAWQVHEVHAGARPAGLRLPDGALDRLAYVIFTSGTTGVPKGVMIDHRGAANTVQAINRLFGVGPGDRVLGVSSLSFDLSVYDIFGVLGAGGVLVLPDARRGHDAQHWAELMRAHRVTLWNSAPQLMRMLADTGAGEAAQLRAVLLSGDFIPLDLPARLRALGCTGRIESLGGATEGSIWSIHHPIGDVDPAWPSIPYGRALPNQTMQVLDNALRPVPDHVRGRIHIGGTGLALGYLGDEALTERRFFIHPHTGERLYDTGDLGRYLEDGSLAIVGRDDGQIKIRGHRVELGEIEAVLRGHPGVAQAVVLLRTGAAGTQRLQAYVQPAPGAHEPTPQSLRELAAEHLPDYMVPHDLMLLDQLPLSANGKLDHAALPELTSSHDAGAGVPPRDRLEADILSVWTNLMPGLDIGITDSFFELGGDSLLATELVHNLNAVLPVRLEMHELFEHLTVESLAALVRQRSDHETVAAGALAPRDTLLADVALASNVIAQQRLPLAPRQMGAIVLTGATGWVGAHLLVELLRSTTADVVCLVRASDDAHARERLLSHLQALGLAPHAQHEARIRVLSADLQAPRLGLSAAAWQDLAHGAHSVFHLAASVSLAQGYAEHRRNNVEPLHALLSLACDGVLKSVYALSPAVVCRRRVGAELVVLNEETVHDDPEGLLTAYAQSKWVGEQILWAATRHGIPVRIYRSAHALPPVAGSAVKLHDTYTTALAVAARVDALPDWPEASLHGLPVDTLCRCWVDDVLRAPHQSAVVHLEPDAAPRLDTVLRAMLDARIGADDRPLLPFAQWQQQCLQAAQDLPAPQAALARLLFEPRPDGAAIENMFGSGRLGTAYLESVGWRERLNGLTPQAYWQQLAARIA